MGDYRQKVIDRKINLAEDVFDIRFWVHAHRLPINLLVEKIVAATPPVVQWLLGRGHIDSALLRKYAPRISEAMNGMRGCYGDFGENGVDNADYIGS